MDGNLASNPDEERLAKSLLDADEEQAAKDADVINEAANYNVQSFVPDMMFESITKNYKNAERIYGPKLLREITGFSNDSLERNAKIPEFQRQLERTLGSRIKSMRKDGLVDAEGNITKDGHHLAQLVMVGQELDKFIPKGVHGDHEHKIIKDPYGVRDDARPFRAGDRFSDIDVRKTIRTVVRRGRKTITKDDLRISERVGRGKIQIIYAIDASGSMRGSKISMSKRAGIALAHRATMQKNEVGLLVFASEIVQQVRPTRDFMRLVENLSRIVANKETNMAMMIERAMEVFSDTNVTKHLIILTDGMPTVGPNPQEDTLNLVAQARASGISISMIGIALQDEDADFARQVCDMGGGRFMVVQNVEELDQVVIQEYEHVVHTS